MTINVNPLSQRAWLLLLLLVVCLPRVTIDAYLPSLPAMADALHGTDAQLQLTLTMYMAGYALSMLIAGPLSDRYGRRPVLICGLFVYLCSTAACAMSTNVSAIIVARTFQALGGCSGTIIGRVIVCERFPTTVQAVMLSSISAGMALSPVVAPLAGSFVAQWLGWRGVFALLGMAGFTALLIVCRYLSETRPPATGNSRHESLVKIYATLLRDRGFLRYSLAISFVYCTYFPFIAESSSLFQRQLHLSSQIYAAIFGVTIVGYLIGSSVFRCMSKRRSTDSTIACAVVINLGGVAALWGLSMIAPLSTWSIVGPMFIVMLSVGIAIPACQFAVLQPFKHIAGTASGLFFFIQMAIATISGWLLSSMADGSAQPMIRLTVGASVAFVIVFAGLRARGVSADSPISVLPCEGGTASGVRGHGRTNRQK